MGYTPIRTDRIEQFQGWTIRVSTDGEAFVLIAHRNSYEFFELRGYNLQRLWNNAKDRINKSTQADNQLKEFKFE